MSADLNRRLWGLYSRGVVRHTDVFEGLGAHQAEYYTNELRRTEVPALYGFSTRPKPGAEIHALFAGGDRDSPVAFSITDRRYALIDLEEGEVAVHGLHGRASPYQWLKFTDKPKAGTAKLRAARIELRAGQHYILLDADIGMQKGTFDPASELPVNPGGAPL